MSAPSPCRRPNLGNNQYIHNAEFQASRQARQVLAQKPTLADISLCVHETMRHRALARITESAPLQTINPPMATAIGPKDATR